MDRASLDQLLIDVRSGAQTLDAAAETLRALPFTDLGFARVDHHRHIRQGFPEAIYGPGKSAEHCLAIVRELLEHGDGPVILTRASAEQQDRLRRDLPPELASGNTLVWRPATARAHAVAVVTAGTADLAVAHECALTLQAQGIPASITSDVGVAGIHRLLDAMPSIATADVIVAVAGMEGALASVLGGLTDKPVIAVPTSVGYGSSFEGVTALLAMLSSCASGITVVGIDNGFGAACAALRLCNTLSKERS